MQFLDKIDKETLVSLTEKEFPVCVSLYMPVVKQTVEARQNPIRFKDLRTKAVKKMERYGMDKDVIARLSQRLENIAGSQDLWTPRLHGLAVFVSEQETILFRSHYVFSEEAIVDRRFYIRPLLAIQEKRPLNVLLLNQEEVRLVQCEHHECRDMHPPEELQSFSAFLKYHEFEESIQHASAARAPHMHGQGASNDDANENAYLLDYYRHIKNWLGQQAWVQETDTLYVAGDSRNTGLFGQVTDEWPGGIKTLIQKNIKSLDEEALLEAVRTELESRERVEKEAELGRLQAIENAEPERALRRTDKIVTAAHDKRIQTLFIPADECKQWGEYDEEAHKARIEESDDSVGEELYNLAAVRTLQNGGKVFVADRMPDRQGAAICHW